MVRRPRRDEPGSWHHVINRALAKRPYFETRDDKRYFLSGLAREVRAGTVEIHAFCLMTTHFHLLVRSPKAELAVAMRRAQNAYSKYFNRRRGRDGPLVRARFRSKRVETEAYLRAIVRYIDANPVQAGLVASPAEHEYGSAAAHLLGPWRPWLERDWIASQIAPLVAQGAEERAAYASVFAIEDRDAIEETAEFVEARFASNHPSHPLDDLIGSANDQVQDWLRSRARLADGMEIGPPALGTRALTRRIQAELAAHGEWIVEHRRSAWRGSVLARAGLLRDLCSEPSSRIGRALGISPWRVARHVEVHRALLVAETEHARRVARITAAAAVPHTTR